MVALSKDDDEEYAGEDDEEEGEPNGVSARFMPPSLIFHICTNDDWLIATSWWSPNITTPGQDSGK